MKVPILMYHSVEVAGLPGSERPRWDPAYAVTADAFTAQMAWLTESRIRVMSLEELVRGRGQIEGQGIVLTFDDGYASDAAFVLPTLQACGAKATFFVETGAVGEAGRLSQADLRTLVEAGMTIGSHTVTHRFLSDLPTVDARREMADSKKFLEDIAGAPVRFLSAPGGRIDRRTAAIARECGYEGVCISTPGANDSRHPGFLLRRVCVRRHTNLPAFRELAGLHPWRLAQEQLRYWSLRGMKGLLGRRRYAAVRMALMAIREGQWRLQGHG